MGIVAVKCLLSWPSLGHYVSWPLALDTWSFACQIPPYFDIDNSDNQGGWPNFHIRSKTLVIGYMNQTFPLFIHDECTEWAIWLPCTKLLYSCVWICVCVHACVNCVLSVSNNTLLKLMIFVDLLFNLNKFHPNLNVSKKNSMIYSASDFRFWLLLSEWV